MRLGKVSRKKKKNLVWRCQVEHQVAGLECRVDGEVLLIVIQVPQEMKTDG